MKMSQRFYGSICVTDLIAALKEKHSAFKKADNGKVYANVSVWLNDQVDEFKNIMSMQLQSSKEKRETDGKIYVGNFKKSEPKEINKSDVAGAIAAIDDLPF